MTPFDNFLAKHDEESWSATLTTLLRSIHEVDQNATQIWFAFYPLALFQALQQSEDPEKLRQQLLMQGRYYLKDQIDSSHTFLYGHRYWPQVKKAVEKHAREFRPSDQSLPDQIFSVAEQVAQEVKTDNSLTVGITAVAFMTVQQAGLEAFEKAPGKLLIDIAAEAEFSKLALAGATPMFHPACTCSIGAVVDAQARVRGVENLWVVDASIMPIIPRGNTNIPTLMLAEKGAAEMLAERGRR